MPSLNHTNVLYIDRANYQRLQSKDRSVSDIWDILSETGKTNDALSSLTVEYISRIKTEVENILFEGECLTQRPPDTQCATYKSPVLTPQMLDDIASDVKAYLYSKDRRSLPQTTSDPQSYEIINLSDAVSSKILVVVEVGFLYQLTKNKDDLLDFILACLKSIFNQGSYSFNLVRTYLKFKCFSGIFEILSAKSN